jgi:phosphoribosylamine--glycine ligase
MKVLLIGGGAREHAIAKTAVKDDIEFFCFAGNNNPGIAKLCKKFQLGKVTDVKAVVAFAKDVGAEIAVVGPEAPLGEGVANALEAEACCKTVGPYKNAAQIEISKTFMRNLMAKHNLKGGIKFEVLNDPMEARKAVRGFGMPVAIKPVGLTGGKGVKVIGDQLKDQAAAADYAAEVVEKRIGGSSQVVVEELLVGEEFTLQAFTDGRTLLPMPAVQDHKRAFEGDVGPNTGGMGSYSMEDHLLPFMTKKEYDEGVTIMKGILGAMDKDGCPYKGFMYGQFMLTAKGPKVIEVNARFGDPEAMNVLPLLESSFMDICEGIVDGSLKRKKAKFARKATVCKYVVPQGYGLESKVDVPIDFNEKAVEKEGAQVFYASVNERGGKVYTTSSRSIGIVGIADDLATAEKVCERGLSHIKGNGIFMRHDIGKPDAIRKKLDHMKAVRAGKA